MVGDGKLSPAFFIGAYMKTLADFITFTLIVAFGLTMLTLGIFPLLTLMLLFVCMIAGIVLSVDLAALWVIPIGIAILFVVFPGNRG